MTLLPPILLLIAGAPAHAGPAASSRDVEGPLVVSGSARARIEAWSWFTPAAGDADYTLGHVQIREALARSGPLHDWMLEGEAIDLFGIPVRAVRPAPEGQLGLGGAYRAANGSRTTGLFVKQAFYRWKNPGRGAQLRAGRFEFIDGTETVPKDPNLAALKRDRIAHRLLGNFGWSAVGRSFDGLQYARGAPAGMLTLALLRPTRGVFDVDGNADLDVNVAYASWSAANGSADHGRDARLFAADYLDRRRLGKVDNRPAAVRAADRKAIHVQTLGGHYLRDFAVAGGKADLLAWGAVQTGRWGAQHHAADAGALEIGFQPGRVAWKPWIRAGYFTGSGDGNPADGTHRTFFPMIPTPRVYARFPFFNEMNNQDAFVTLMARPAPKWSLRADAHALRLASPADLWYGGGGPFQNDSAGYAGRPAGGRKALANLYDVSLDYQPSPLWAATLYAAVARGGAVVQSIYPRGRDASLLYAELLRKW